MIDAKEEQAFSASIAELSNIGVTIDGSSFAYQNLKCVGKRLNSLEDIVAFKDVQQIDLSFNAIREVGPLSELPFILNLNLASNNIDSIAEWGKDVMPYLLQLDLRNNRFSTFPSLFLPSLKSLSFATNKITDCRNFTGHPSLMKLNLSENRITNSVGIANLPNLTELDLSGNSLTELDGLSGIPLLQSLDLASNSLEGISASWLGYPFLMSLNLSQNKIKDLKSLAVIVPLSRLKSLDITDNPFTTAEGVDDVRAEMLIFHGGLESINCAPVTDEGREAAKELHAKRLEEEQRRLQEQAEAEVAAAAAVQDQ